MEKYDTKILLRLKKKQSRLLDSIVETGYYNTKSEAIRAGIINLYKDLSKIEIPLKNYKENANKEKLLWEKMKETELKKIWNLENDSTWESYLTKKELKKLNKKYVKKQ